MDKESQQQQTSASAPPSDTSSEQDDRKARMKNLRSLVRQKRAASSRARKEPELDGVQETADIESGNLAPADSPMQETAPLLHQQQSIPETPTSTADEQAPPPPLKSSIDIDIHSRHSQHLNAQNGPEASNQHTVGGESTPTPDTALGEPMLVLHSPANQGIAMTVNTSDMIDLAEPPPPRFLSDAARISHRQHGQSDALVYAEGERGFKKISASRAAGQTTERPKRPEWYQAQQQRRLLYRVTILICTAAYTLQTYTLSVAVGAAMISLFVSPESIGPDPSSYAVAIAPFLQTYVPLAFKFSRLFDILITSSLVLTTRDLHTLIRSMVLQTPELYCVRTVLAGPADPSLSSSDDYDGGRQTDQRKWQRVVKLCARAIAFIGLLTAYGTHLLLFQIDDNIWLSINNPFGNSFGSGTWYQQPYATSEQQQYVGTTMSSWVLLNRIRTISVLVSWSTTVLLNAWM